MPRLLPALVSLLTAIPTFSLASPLTTTPASCIPYTPIGWSHPSAKLYFYDNNPTDQPSAGAGLHAPTLPANATIAPNKYLLLSNHSNPSSAGYTFSLSACNISSLALTTNTTQSSCTHGSCYHTYTNYVHIINPATGHCLSTKTYNVSSSTIRFEACDAAPVDSKQVWEVSQQVTYAPGYASVYSYGTVDVYPYSPTDEGQPTLGYFFDWSLSRGDNRTLTVVEDGYSQVGLSARLLEA